VPCIPRPWCRWCVAHDFGGIRNRILIQGDQDADTLLLAEKELIRLREESKVLQRHSCMNTPFGVVVEKLLACYVGRPAYQDFCNELHWFMGGSSAAESSPDQPKCQPRETNSAATLRASSSSARTFAARA
jgi:hypothetical protein